MYVHWKPLVLFGFIFWIALIATDVLRRQKILDAYVLEPPPIFASTRKLPEIKEKTPVAPIETSEEEKVNFHSGTSMLLTNIFIFIFSLVFCSLAKFIATLICKGYKRYQKVKDENTKFEECLTVEPPFASPTQDDLVIVDPVYLTASETVLCEKKLHSTETSCPNLTSVLTKANRTCQTMFHPSFKLNERLRAECAKLREELLALNANSIKENALLSKKLDSITKEKKDISRRLMNVQKENQVARKQLDELVNERKLLQHRLEDATKNFLVNTRTKKAALAKLEQTSSAVDDLRNQLEQVTRDKEILQGKLDVLRDEYEQIQERLRLMQLKEAGHMCRERALAMKKEEAERDENGIDNTVGKIITESSQSSLEQTISKESVFLPYVLSQTEVDMKNIQMKISQLEKNLRDMNSDSDVTKIEDFNKPELESPIKTSSEEPNSSTTPLKIMAKNDVSCKKSYDEMKVQVLRSALKEKIKILENIRERGDESSTVGTNFTSGEDEFDLSSEDNSSPRIVSNSEAFQRFLKNIGAETSVVPIGDSKLHSE